MKLKIQIVVAALCAVFSAQIAIAADDAGAAASTPIKSARKETLDLPGVTACHTCEWRPMRKEMETDQCADKIGIFDCGRDTNCDKKCEFVKCAAE